MGSLACPAEWTSAGVEIAAKRMIGVIVSRFPACDQRHGLSVVVFTSRQQQGPRASEMIRELEGAAAARSIWDQRTIEASPRTPASGSVGARLQ
jgi:hypothetical protein